MDDVKLNTIARGLREEVSKKTVQRQRGGCTKGVDYAKDISLAYVSNITR